MRWIRVDVGSQTPLSGKMMLNTGGVSGVIDAIELLTTGL